MADFKETLHVKRVRDHHFCLTPFYEYWREREDLADETTECIDWNSQASLGDACKAVDNFSPTVDDAKKAINILLENDEVFLSDEY